MKPWFETDRLPGDNATMEPNPTKPLSGKLVLDLTNVLAGPFCCHQLAQFGARVIKVEPPGRGDLARQLGADAQLNESRMGVSFLAQNAGKESLTLNLKHPTGKDLLMQLVRRADVLVENFRPGVMTRLGLDWPTLKAVNPSLIYCAISGFGQTGPWVDRPAYDQVVQGLAGVMSVTGAPDDGPMRVGYPVSDTIGGLTAAMAICAALPAAKDSGGGRFIDVSMLEATLASMGWVVSNYLIAGQTPAQQGNENATSAPSGLFEASDGPLNIAANKDEQWQTLARLIGREDLIDHPDYLNREQRKRHRLALRSEINKALANRTSQQWADILNAASVPAGPVLSVPQVLSSEQLRARSLLSRYDDVPGVDRPIDVISSGVKLNGQPTSVDEPPPVLGQHTAAILGELGQSPAQIEALKAAGVI